MTLDWMRQILSADQEIKQDLPRLRGAARSLVRDNAYAERYLALLEENVVGAYGIRLQSTIQTTRDDPHTALNKKVEAAWKRWARARTASIDGRLSWVDIQKLVVRTVAQDGEVFVRFWRGMAPSENPFGFALELLDPDLVDHTLTVFGEKSPTGNDIVMGIELAPKTRRPIAYWMWTEHPSEFGATSIEKKRVRVPAEEVRHLYRVRRVAQTRGVTHFAPVMLDMKMAGAYQEAEITAARIGASNMAAVIPAPNDDGDEDLAAAANDGRIPMEVEPGRFLRLNPGDQLQATSFDHPNSGFGTFIKNIWRSVAAGLGVSYTSLANDLEAVNYSSGRIGLLQERDNYRSWQEWLIEQFCRPVFEAWLPMASLYEHLPARDMDAEDARFMPRGWPTVDPLKDMQAAALAVREGFDTRTAICAETGGDFAENVAQLAAEQDLAKAAGVTLGEADLTPTAPQKNPTPDDEAGDSSNDQPARRLQLARSLS
jgi:lambda family phage portal protein